VAPDAGLNCMFKPWALTKKAQYKRVYDLGSGRGDRLIVVKNVANGLEFSRCGFSTTKRLGKAVVRNRVRRILKEIARTAQIKPGWDIVFIARQGAAEANYHEIKKSVEKSLLRAELVNKNEAVSAGVN
jgi:ribonuclease P protein component